MDTLRLAATLNAVAFYESQGYVAGEQITRAMGGVDVPSIRMSRRLRRASEPPVLRSPPPAGSELTRRCARGRCVRLLLRVALERRRPLRASRVAEAEQDHAARDDAHARHDAVQTGQAPRRDGSREHVAE